MLHKAQNTVQMYVDEIVDKLSCSLQVILVSTSGASGVGGGVYQRSLSVPVMKSSTSSPAPPTVMRGVPASANQSPLTSATQMQSGVILINKEVFYTVHSLYFLR